jgi:2-polyprenyl-3-methyl-5-hydroxy-6-metoxy-1,4-benzoquinol methylase
LGVPVSEVRCHVCAAPSLEEVQGFTQLCRVTSDCKPWPRGGRLFICNECRSVQKLIDREWFQEIERIYKDYTIYFQSEGVEQAVFDGTSGQAALRSVRLLEALAAHVKLPETGRLLDLGCGNGAMLRAFSRFATGWTLAGVEMSEKNREAVESIERVEALYTCQPEQVPGRFDLISMIHMLEHIPNPVEYLSRLQDKLNPGGLLLIQLPNYPENPFDLLVADHASHFTARTAAELIGRCGYEAQAVATDWIPKELTVVARKAERDGQARAVTKSEGSRLDSPGVTKETVRWLEETRNRARLCASKGSFGLFGTSIAAMWLFAELEDSISFFVDEDPSRVGKTILGRKIYHPSEAPAGSHVFIALTTMLAELVLKRVERPDVNFYLPPALSV